MIAELLAIVAPTLACAMIGFGWGRWGPGLDPERTTKLITHIGAPCLVFSSLIALDVQTASLVRIATGAVLALFVSGVLGWIGLRIVGLPHHTFLPPIMFGNGGNMGLPVCLFAFGDEGLALAVCFFAVAATAQYTVGVAIWSGRIDLRELVRTPLTIAALLAVGVLWSGFAVPGWIHDTTRLMGGLTIPLMLMNLGESIGRMHVQRLARSASLSVFRLALGIGVGIGVTSLLELQPLERNVLIVQCAMPAAVFNYLLAQQYDRSPEEVASIVVLSTLIAFPMLPVLLAFLI